jgi:hypothetical protein
VILGFFLFALIYLPAMVRIYYILLFDAKGVFTATERQWHQKRKQFWEKVLFKGGLLVGAIIVGLGVFLSWTRLSH